jgi:Flp pilus assembly protein TadG
MKPRKRHKTGKRLRRGAAVVEFAVCLPIIIIIVFGAIEAASLLFLRQALIQSAYEGAKVAIKANAENSDVLAAAESVAAGRNLTDMTVTLEPSDVSTANAGDLIRISISAPGDSNSLIQFGPFKNRTVSARAVMVKE